MSEDKVKKAQGVPAKIDALIENANAIIDGMEADLNAGESVASVCGKARSLVAGFAAKKHEIK